MAPNEGIILTGTNSQRKNLSIRGIRILLIITGILLILGIWRIINGEFDHISFWLVIAWPVNISVLLFLEAHFNQFVTYDTKGINGKIGLFKKFEHSWESLRSIQYTPPVLQFQLNDGDVIDVPLTFANYDVRKNQIKVLLDFAEQKGIQVENKH